MAKTVHLNGGPIHDCEVSLEDGATHFHIQEPVVDAVRRAIAEMKEPPQPGFTRLPLREGTYSQVQHRPGEFELDGWVTHD